MAIGNSFLLIKSVFTICCHSFSVFRFAWNNYSHFLWGETKLDNYTVYLAVVYDKVSWFLFNCRDAQRLFQSDTSSLSFRLFYPCSYSMKLPYSGDPLQWTFSCEWIWLSPRLGSLGQVATLGICTCSLVVVSTRIHFLVSDEPVSACNVSWCWRWLGSSPLEMSYPSQEPPPSWLKVLNEKISLNQPRF